MNLRTTIIRRPVTTKESVMKIRILSFTLTIFLFGMDTSLAASDPATDWIGVRGPNGSGVYPDSKPPTSWDLTTGRNVRWVMPLNGWGQGQPVIADGKVFIMLEPDVNHLFPRLQCLDLITGKVLWEDMLDHLPTAIPDEVERAKVYKMVERQNQATTLGAVFEREYRFIAKTDEERAAVVASWRKRGFIPAHRTDKGGDSNLDEKGLVKMHGNGPLDDQLKMYLPEAEKKTTNPTLLRYGIWEEIYQANCNFACIGKTFGAPVWCDGAIYVATAGGVLAKYDMNGKRQWLTWSFKPGLTGLNGSGHDTCVRSPIIAGDLFIGTAANNLVAIERATGKVRFKDDLKSESIASPVVLTVGKSEILLTAGPKAYLLPGGKPLKVEGWLFSGMQALVKHDERDVVLFCGSGEHCDWPKKGIGDTPPPAAVRYTLDGDTLRGKILWSGVQETSEIETAKGRYTEGMGGNAPWLLYDQGRFYHRNGPILDALTGKITVGKLVRDKSLRPSPDRAVPPTEHLLQLAGGNVYGWDHSIIVVYSCDGKKVASNVFPDPHVTKEQLPIWHGVDSRDDYFSGLGGKKRGMLSYGHQFTFGKDCLVARTLMHLYCFSEGSQSAPQPTTPVK